MNITRPMQFALHLYTAGVINARRDYADHPSEFTKRRWCVDCSGPKRYIENWRCEACNRAYRDSCRIKRRRAAA